MLKALELVGFKSFADKTRFDFPPGITAVVGPNGSGKSNVVDAIKWVLGEQSVKTLRGKEMADVIFNGSASRAPLNYAETTLTLNNVTRRLPIDTPEVLVTRRVYRNGEGEYLLNRQPCRLRDIRELFVGTGVATEAYSVIEQGKVDVLLQSSPRERRLIFEEAAGISRFKAKKVESLRRLERVEQNLLRLGDIVAEVEHRLRQVRLQAAKARRYQEHADRLQELRTYVGLVDWRQHSARLAEMDATLATLAEQRATALLEADRADASAVADESTLAEISDRIRTSEGRGAQIREGIATREATNENQRRRSAELEKEALRLRRQLAAVSVRVGSLQQQWNETVSHVATAEQEYARVVTATTIEDQRLADVTGRLTAMRRQAEQSREAHLSEMRKAAAWESEASTLTARLESARSRRQQHEQKLSDLAAAGEVLATEIAEFHRQDSALALAMDEQHRRETSAHERLTTLSEQQQKLLRELDQARQQLAASRERATVLEEFQRRRDGYGESVKQVLAQAQAEPNGVFRHVRGVVAELLQVNLEMAPLIEVALAERAQHIVVTSLDEMLASLRQDPQQFSSQITFTPIDDRTHGTTTREVDLHGEVGIVGRADEFVHTSPPFVPLAVRLLGHTWIVDSLSRAAELARKHVQLTFVTLTGEACSGAGTLSCGPCSPSAGLISRQSELEMLRAQVAELETSIAGQTTTSVAVAADMAEVQRSLADAELEHAHLAASLGELRLRSGTAQERSTQIEIEQKRLRLDLGNANQQADAAETGLQTLHARLQAARTTLATMESQAAELTAQTAALDQERSATEAEVAATKIELGKREERLANLRLRAHQLEQDQRERRRTVDEVASELAQCLERLIHAERTVLAAESELAILYLDKEQAVDQTTALIAEQEAGRGRRTASLSAVQRLRTEMRQLDERMHAHELATHEVRHARTAVADRLQEDYGLDLAAFEPPMTNDEARQREEIDLEIAELRRKIAHIGNVNLDALAELEELEQRFGHLSQQFKDLTEAKQSLVEIIDRINTDSRRLFTATLEQVRINFQALFRKMFGGGQADIVQDEGVDLLESGIEIVARPPGKEPRNISLLSGGEKTLTCVALLLAIFQYRPSPFCVLDEVDAALDEANIERFITVLQEFLAWTQFIVVTHSKKTMTCATTLYGVTMQESGVSKRVSVRFEDVSTDDELRPEEDASAKGAAGDDETQAA
ncbi:MAG TPA: chromosome segregation protein SMC [Pirellulales bacterium]|jgi:chromosome segregation protein